MGKSEDIMRKCIVTGEVKDKSQLLRFVVTPEGVIVPDLYKKFPGKGVYVSVSYKALSQAIAKNYFAKSLKKKVKVMPDLLQTVENLLHQKALHAISLAKKAGDVVIGLDNVLDTLRAGKAVFVSEAIDAGDDGQKKLQHCIQEFEVYRLFTVDELDQILGKVNTAYLAFLDSKMSDMVKDNFDKLLMFLIDKNGGDKI